MNVLHWFYKLSWKKLIGAGIFLLLIALVPTTLQLATNPTRTRSEAALIHPSPQPITKQFQAPQGPPQIYLVDHFFGKVGDAVLIHGENLGGLHPQSAVYLAGQKISEDNLVSWTANYIEFKVPQDSRSGRVELNILGQTASWPGVFFVIDENTNTEINFVKSSTNPNLAGLVVSHLPPAREMLLWLLVVNSDVNLQLNQFRGTVRQFSLPLGKVYELTLKDLKEGQLFQVVKTPEAMVGIARLEIAKQDGALVPVKINPLYVSF